MCTMEAKLCPDGKTYVGRDSNNNCEFTKCPDEQSCAPYQCKDGTTAARCSSDGHVINYFAAPCMTHGGEVGEAPESFSDVPSTHANAEAIAYVKAQGIVEGYADGTYKPDANINRAEFVKIIDLAIESGNDCAMLWVETGTPFTDVSVRDWFSPYLCYLYHQKIVSGYPDGTFRPAANINFVEAAKITTKALGLEASTTLPVCEGDCPWYRPAVLMLEMKNAIPTSISRFDQLITRGEMAEMIFRLKTGNNDKPSQTYEELK